MKYFNKVFYLAFLFCSCQHWLDVNDDPNNAIKVIQGDEIFTSALLKYSTNRTIDLGPAVATASQLWSGGGSLGVGVFTNPEKYVFSPFTLGNSWRVYYLSDIKNLRLAMYNSAGKQNTIAQCKIIEALNFFSATVLWEDIPFTEAVSADFEKAEITNLHPVFDAQEKVLKGIVELLEEAIELIDADLPNQITNGDLIYNGDMEKWRKLAKSLKLRTLITIADRDPSVHSEIQALIAEGDLILDQTDNAAFPFFDTPGNRNPIWGVLYSFAGGENLYFFATEAMVEAMKAKSDPRIENYFTPYPDANQPSPMEVVGAPAGVINIGFSPWVLSAKAEASNALIHPSKADVLFSAQESYFIQSLAVAKGWAQGNLHDLFIQGVRQAMLYNEIAEDKVEAYIQNLPDLTELSLEDQLKEIGSQLFIDCVIRPVEGWLYWRLIEYPQLKVPEAATVNQLARRLPYPQEELDANSNAPSNPKKITEKMWFEQ